jgi:anti-sigma regulatory factor (Ser/Thr protein kinase)
MVDTFFQTYSIEDRSYVSFIKREIHNLVRPHFNETRTGEIDIVVSEICSNIIKYASKGELLYRLGTEADESFFEIIGIDEGPGIKDLQHSIKDGVSSKNTLGQGLGSIVRMSNISAFYSLPDWGTIVYAKFYKDPSRMLPKETEHIRTIRVCKPGEKVCGDGVSVKRTKTKTLLFTGDGLGHGPNAEDAVNRAIEVFQKSKQADPPDIIREIHTGVKKTRGLVATVVLLDYEEKQWKLCGVGNISSRLQKGLEYRNYVGNNGIVGFNIPTRLENCIYGMEKMQCLILCSDGIRTKWDLLKYPSILKHDPAILAAAIYKDNARKTDDMTIVIVKIV